MNTDALTLRETNNPPLTNKGDRILNSEYDQNWIDAYNDFLSLAQAPLITAYNALTLYDDTDNPFASYNNRLWKWVNTSSGSGVTPVEGADWTEIFPTQLAHQQNKDTYLAKGTSDEVTANEIRTFIDTPVSSSNLGTDDLTSSDPLRKFILAGPLSADGISFRDSTDSFDHFLIRGDGNIYTNGNGKTINFGTGGGRISGSNSGNAQLAQHDLFNCRLSNGFNANSQDINSAKNVKIGTVLTGNGNGVLALGNAATVPTIGSVNVVLLYTKTGTDLFMMDENNVETQIV